ncbi:hypothetical protein F5Y04DRAFT_260009 [Hypomontagnella monticulosa]|nr:hypothetical protein F5Y04DRAFT_260009 [Hypomontagnella monticulosa]
MPRPVVFISGLFHRALATRQSSLQADSFPLHDPKMAATADQSLHSTVAERAGSCLHSFQQCVQIAALIHPRELSLVEDQLARFSIWTTNIRVFAPGRASLDHRLREAFDVQDAVIGLLDALSFHVKNCSNSLESLTSKVIQESGQPLSEVDPTFHQSIRSIANEIGLLHRFSNTVRRASKESQDLKAVGSFRIRDEEGNDTEDFITKLFVNHIRDRFPGVCGSICQRLAETMVLRRKRILYRRSRFEGTPTTPQETLPEPQVTGPSVRVKIRSAQQPRVSGLPQIIDDSPKSAIQSVARSATMLVPGNFQKASTPSVVSVSKTVSLNSHEELPFPPVPLGSIKRKYYETMEQREQTDNYEHSLNAVMRENEPKSFSSAWKEKTEGMDEIIKAVGEITCPFCLHALPAEDLTDDNKWRLHVKNDLDAFVCLFEDCSLPHELYSHSSAWLKHMREHAMRWRCTSKSHEEYISKSREDYITHMKTVHKDKFSEAQLQVLANRAGRVLGPIFRSCPLCGKEEVGNAMDNHIVGHLRLLALKSLPIYDDTDLEDAQSEKCGSSNSRSGSRRSTIENELGGPDPAFFEDIETHYKVLETGHRRLEWGFIPDPYNTTMEDPILRKFNVGHSNERLSEYFPGPSNPPINPSNTRNKTEGSSTSDNNEYHLPLLPKDDVAARGNATNRVRYYETDAVIHRGDIAPKLDANYTPTVSDDSGNWNRRLPPPPSSNDMPPSQVQRDMAKEWTHKEVIKEEMQDAEKGTTARGTLPHTSENLPLPVSMPKLQIEESLRAKDPSRDLVHSNQPVPSQPQENPNECQQSPPRSPNTNSVTVTQSISPTNEAHGDINELGSSRDTPQKRPGESGLDPDCALCHAPASVACVCEAKAFEIALHQVEDKIISSMYNRIRVWVRHQAQELVLRNFSESVQDYGETAASGSSSQESTGGAERNHTSPTKEEFNSIWTSAVIRFPEVLEYYFSLVELTLPADDDPQVKDPPIRPPIWRPPIRPPIWRPPIRPPIRPPPIWPAQKASTQQEDPHPDVRLDTGVLTKAESKKGDLEDSN